MVKICAVRTHIVSEVIEAFVVLRFCDSTVLEKGFEELYLFLVQAVVCDFFIFHTETPLFVIAII